MGLGIRLHSEIKSDAMKKKQALIILNSGFEEMETVAPIDLLRRAGVEVTVASMTGERLVRGRNDLVLQATHDFGEACGDNLYDAIILPGGPGIKPLREHPELCALLKKHHAAGKILACICAGPLLLLDSGLLPGRYTAHPSTLAELPHPEEPSCVWDGRILTSKGAGTAAEFGLNLVEALKGRDARSEIAQAICD